MAWDGTKQHKYMVWVSTIEDWDAADSIGAARRDGVSPPVRRCLGAVMAESQDAALDEIAATFSRLGEAGIIREIGTDAELPADAGTMPHVLAIRDREAPSFSCR